MKTEEAAIKFVLDYEKKQGRVPEDVHSVKKHRGYDVLSRLNGEIVRTIEVKGTRSGIIPALCDTEVKDLKLVPSHLYIVSIKKDSDEKDRFFIIERSKINPADFKREERYKLCFGFSSKKMQECEVPKKAEST